MSDRRRDAGRRAIDGIVLLNKPAGMTSNAALQRVKRLLRAKKAGHTGSLDPAATGMLPLCFGEATKASAYLLDADKTYRVVARLGEATNTGDADGEVTTSAAVPALGTAEWQALLEGFLGESEQVPPMYSALKKDGQRLYELARKGESVEREPRPIRISRIELLEIRGSRLVFRVSCSKGTYVRTLVEDIAAVAGTVAHTRRLHRESVAGFGDRAMLSLGGLERRVNGAGNDWMLPVEAGLGHLAEVAVAADEAGRFAMGQAVPAECTEPGVRLRVYGPGRKFLGVGESVEAGRITPKRIFHLADERLDEGQNGASAAVAGDAVDL